jgi:hypothetical protein
MDGTGAGNDQQAVLFSRQNIRYLFSAGNNRVSGGIRQWQNLLHFRGGYQGFELFYVDVKGFSHGGLLCRSSQPTAQSP